MAKHWQLVALVGGQQLGGSWRQLEHRVAGQPHTGAAEAEAAPRPAVETWRGPPDAREMGKLPGGDGAHAAEADPTPEAPREGRPWLDVGGPVPCPTAGRGRGWLLLGRLGAREAPPQQIQAAWVRLAAQTPPPGPIGRWLLQRGLWQAPQEVSGAGPIHYPHIWGGASCCVWCVSAPYCCQYEYGGDPDGGHLGAISVPYPHIRGGASCRCMHVLVPCGGHNDLVVSLARATVHRSRRSEAHISGRGLVGNPRGSLLASGGPRHPPVRPAPARP